MPKEFVIFALAGSIRQGSTNRGLLLALQDEAPTDIRIELADISGLPHYNADKDGDEAPPAVIAFCNQMRRSDAVLIATPEYNHSIPGVLKNALDWAGSSRSKPSPALRGNPVAVLGAAPGKSGTIRAQMVLKSVLLACKCHIMMTHDTYYLNSTCSFDSNGHVIDPDIRRHMMDVAIGLKAWAEFVSKLKA
jgi:chromate reductase